MQNQIEQSENDQGGIYLFKVNNRNTRTRHEICSKFTIKTPERRQLGTLNYHTFLMY